MSEELELSEQAALTRAMWNEDAPNWVERGRAAWASPAPWWGMYELPEAELGVLPDVTEAPDFCIPHGEMLSLLNETGFVVEALHELRAPDGPAEEVRYFMSRAWARRWPAEDVWVARRREPST